MQFSTLSDEAILYELADRIDLIRRKKGLSDHELIQKSGSNSSTLNRFRSHEGGISLINFIRLLRGLGELDGFDTLLEDDKSYSPAQQIISKIPKRIRKSTRIASDFTWGEDKS